MSAPASSTIRCPVCNGTRAQQARVIDGFTLWRCAGCTLVFVWPRPDRARSAESYAAGRRGDPALGAADADAAALFATYDTAHTPYVRRALARRLARLHRRRPLGRVLDFGCGSGHLLQLARSLYGSTTCGIELHPVAREGARRFGFTLHAGGLESAPFEPGSFDLVYSVQVFEHLPEPRPELAGLAALLRPGGLLFLEVPHEGSLAIRLGRDRFLHNRPPGHLNYFTRKAMRRLLSSAGLEMIALRTTGLDHRSLLGRSPAPAAREFSQTPPTPPASPRPASGPRAVRTRLRVLEALDLALSLPGWGMQLEALARRPS